MFDGVDELLNALMDLKAMKGEVKPEVLSKNKIEYVERGIAENKGPQKVSGLWPRILESVDEL